MFCGTPGYIPTEEEREEVVQLVMSIHAWMLGLPDPRERISLADAQPQPQPQSEPQLETPSAPEPGPAATRTPPARPRRPRTVA